MKIWALAGVILAACVFWGLWQRGQAALARAEVIALQIDLAAAQEARQWALEAAAVHRAHLDRLARQRAAFEGLRADIANMEGQDAPLSDLLGAAAGRLWP